MNARRVPAGAEGRVRRSVERLEAIGERSRFAASFITGSVLVADGGYTAF